MGRGHRRSGSKSNIPPVPEVVCDPVLVREQRGPRPARLPQIPPPWGRAGGRAAVQLRLPRGRVAAAGACRVRPPGGGNSSLAGRRLSRLPRGAQLCPAGSWWPGWPRGLCSAPPPPARHGNTHRPAPPPPPVPCSGLFYNTGGHPQPAHSPRAGPVSQLATSQDRAPAWAGLQEALPGRMSGGGMTRARVEGQHFSCGESSSRPSLWGDLAGSLQGAEGSSHTRVTGRRPGSTA